MDINEKDDQLWKLANKRAKFQRGLVLYFVMNAFFWLIWYFTAGKYGYNRTVPWPIWSMLGWGLSLIFQYMEAYGAGKESLVNKEYEKLKKQQENNI